MQDVFNYNTYDYFVVVSYIDLVWVVCIGQFLLSFFYLIYHILSIIRNIFGEYSWYCIMDFYFRLIGYGIFYSKFTQVHWLIEYSSDMYNSYFVTHHTLQRSDGLTNRLKCFNCARVNLNINHQLSMTQREFILITQWTAIRFVYFKITIM